MKRKRHSRKNQKSKQKSFVQHWSPYDQKKQYNALEDPHANYYFYSKPVNHHLKQLKKAVNHQKNTKKKQQLKQLINTKLTAIKLPIIKGSNSPKTAIYANQINKSMSNMPIQYRKNSDFTGTSNKNRQSKNQSSFSVVEMNRYRKLSKQNQKQDLTKANKPNNQINDDRKLKNPAEIEKSHRQSHTKFLNYLVQRKNKLIMNSTEMFVSKTENNQIKSQNNQTKTQNKN